MSPELVIRKHVRALPTLAAALVATLLLAACGSSSSGVQPSAYVHTVCTTLGTWRSGVQGASTHLQSSVTGSTTVPQLKQQYQTFVSALLSNTDSAKAKLKAAGVPGVSNGGQISSSLVRAFTNASSGLQKAQSQAAQLPTGDGTTFKTAVAGVTQTISGALSSMKDVSPKKDRQLHDAAGKDAACTALKSA
jgi:hypothetical protein